MITTAVNLFRFAPLCQRLLGTLRASAGLRFANNALVAMTNFLANRELLYAKVTATRVTAPTLHQLRTASFHSTPSKATHFNTGRDNAEQGNNW